MKFFTRVFLTPLVLVAVLTTSFGTLFMPRKAEAVFGVGDIVFDPSTFGQQLYEWAESFVRATLKRRILDVMVDQVVTWIQGGGEPRFITDWESFLGDIGQGAVGEFVEKIGAGFLCEPFSLQVRLNLLPVQRFGNNAPFSCTLDKIVQNVEDFYKDFRNGNWIAYNAQWQPQNNYYGALLIAWDARNNYVADKLAAAANNALANKGFLGTRRCYDADTGATVSEAEIQDQKSAINPADPRTGSFRQYSIAQGGGRTRSIRCEDTTPGGVVSAALEKAVGTDFDFIINAQQLGDYAAAIVNALVNRLIMEGVNGIRGVHSGSGGTYQPSRNAGTTYGGFQSTSNIPSGTRTAISNYSGTSAGTVSTLSRSQLLTRLNTALARRRAAHNTFTDALVLARAYVSITDSVLSCHATVPALTSGAIHDAVLQKNADANNDLGLVTAPMQNNLDAIDELTQTIDQLNRLTDTQYRARINEFQVVLINSEASIVNAETGQASSLLQQLRTLITPAVIADTQRDLDYCVSQGGTAPQRGTP